MKGKGKISVFILVALLVLLVIAQLYAPKPIDWSPNYERAKKSPFGTYIVHDILPWMFHGKISHSNQTLYNSLKRENYENTSFVIISNSFKPSKTDRDALFEFVEKGNNVLVAADYFDESFTDSLHIETDYYYQAVYDLFKPGISIGVCSPGLRSDSAFFFSSVRGITIFSSEKEMAIHAMADDSSIVMTSVKVGEGRFFLSSFPWAFGNQYMVQPSKQEFACSVLSHLPDENLIWDDYYKPFSKVRGTPLRYILDNQALKIGYFLALAGMLFFLLFRTRRKQRIIRIVPPNSNSSIEFITTLARLYLKKRNHRNIAEKRYQFLLDSIRNRYHLATLDLNDDFFSRLAMKSGVSEDRLKCDFRDMTEIRLLKSISSEQLSAFNRLVENFYKNSQ
ncbi:MAG: DUF4350 domain-containing protein [Bacteroidetes bacterium]|nr:DUF4350 domain-containing protein [Bacteroidota bacterium]MBU1717748.1 DUF4350 domain-containing protein [Bacteroidota bacterium]